MTARCAAHSGAHASCAAEPRATEAHAASPASPHRRLAAARSLASASRRAVDGRAYRPRCTRVPACGWNARRLALPRRSSAWSLTRACRLTGHLQAASRWRRRRAPATVLAIVVAGGARRASVAVVVELVGRQGGRPAPRAGRTCCSRSPRWSARGCCCRSCSRSTTRASYYGRAAATAGSSFPDGRDGVRARLRRLPLLLVHDRGGVADLRRRRSRRRPMRRLVLLQVAAVVRLQHDDPGVLDQHAAASLF